MPFSPVGDTGASADRRVALQEWQRFIRADGHVLNRYPSLLFQQAANQPDATAPSKGARRRLRDRRETRPWFRWSNKETSSVTAYEMTLTGHTSSVYACAVAPDGRRAVSAGWDGVRLWDLGTGEAISSA